MARSRRPGAEWVYCHVGCRAAVGEGVRLDIIREFTIHFAVGEAFEIGAGPHGSRTVAAVGGGWVKGDRITGHLVGPAADWAMLGSDGYAQIDVRAQIRTDDGADLYISYNGSLELTEATMAALISDDETIFGDAYWFTHVRIESGAEPYQWVNRTMFIGQGRMASDGVEYEVYRLA